MTDKPSILSAARMLLYRSGVESWRRGEQYVREGKVVPVRFDDTSIDAVAHGTQDYAVRLAFKHGGLSRSCSCPVADFCKHEIALAILWDEQRGITRPSGDEVQDVAIPPPDISHAEIMSAFRDPLNADLDVIRFAAEQRGWGRPHARLPDKPKMADGTLTLEDIVRLLDDIGGWSVRRNFDPYFCAGEMMAAFCEVMRRTMKQWETFDSDMKEQIIVIFESFEEELLSELIDDSDGIHEFSTAHIEYLEEHSE